MKNRDWIILMIVFSILLFIFVPTQKTSYLENDIKNFKNKYYLNFAVIVSLLLILIVVIISLIKNKTYKAVLNNTLGVSVFCIWFFCFFQSILIGFALLINKQSNKVEVSKSFKIISITANKYLSAYNIDNENDYINEDDYKKTTKKKNLHGLENGKIVTLKFNRGILGINYIPE